MSVTGARRVNSLFCRRPLSWDSEHLVRGGETDAISALLRKTPHTPHPHTPSFSHVPEAPADIIPEFTAIFKIMTSTAAAWPPSATVARVIPAITSKVAKITNTINRIDNSCVSKHLRQRNVADSLYDPLTHAAHCKMKQRKKKCQKHDTPMKITTQKNKTYQWTSMKIPTSFFSFHH